MNAKRISLWSALVLAAGCAGSNGTKPASEPATPVEPAATHATAPAEPAPTLLAEGTVAPDFSVQDQRGNTVTLSKLRGKPVVLYWYPRDDSPG